MKTTQEIQEIAKTIHSEIRKEAIVWYFTDPKHSTEEFFFEMPSNVIELSPEEKELVKEAVVKMVAMDIDAVIVQATQTVNEMIDTNPI